jgi:hypothetical protein
MGYVLTVTQRDRGKTRKSSVRIGDHPTEILVFQIFC